MRRFYESVVYEKLMKQKNPVQFIAQKYKKASHGENVSIRSIQYWLKKLSNGEMITDNAAATIACAFPGFEKIDGFYLFANKYERKEK